MEKLVSLFPLVNVLFGNIAEFSFLFRNLINDPKEKEEIFPKIEGYSSSLIHSLRVFSVRFNSMNIIITNGKYSTLFALNGKIESESVNLISNEEIRDTIGAGDAFVAGVLLELLTQKKISDCIKFGHKLASEILKVSGVPSNIPFSIRKSNQ